jgi:hypothetical protein
MAAMSFEIKARFAGRIRWSKRGSCGEAGCSDPECCCALCLLPIGVPDDDPRWESHSEWCDDCDLCRDRVPAALFRGEGRKMEQAQFHTKCFEKIVFFRQGCPAASKKA